MPAARSSRPVTYSVHPGVAMVQNWVASLPEKTGKSLDQWIGLARKSGPRDEAALRDWLKAEHGHGTNAAWWLAERAAGKSGGEEDTPAGYLEAADRYVEAMYSGARAGLKPLHDALIQLALSLGDDIKICPCQTIVPVYRTHVIAQIKPSTRTRIDFGLALGDTKPTKRLLSTGGFAKKDRITHRVEITELGDVDGQLLKWLKQAYARDQEPARGHRAAKLR